MLLQCFLHSQELIRDPLHLKIYLLKGWEEGAHSSKTYTRYQRLLLLEEAKKPHVEDKSWEEY
jgi:hypothetical protein